MSKRTAVKRNGVQLKEHFIRLRFLPVTWALCSVCAAPLYGQQNIWGPWEYAGTLYQHDPLAQPQRVGEPMWQGDEYGARFDLSTDTIQVEVFLGILESRFDPAQTALRIRVYDEASPYNMQAEQVLSIDDDDWGIATWYGAEVSFTEQLTGHYWVTLYVEESTADWSVSMEHEHADGLLDDLTYDGLAGDYLERDGLLYRSDTSTWTEDYADPFIRIKQKTGTNYAPTVVTATVAENPITEGETVTFSATAEDLDGWSDLQQYRWYCVTADGQDVELKEAGDFTQQSATQASTSFNKDDLAVGTHHVYFKVKDPYGWSAPYEVGTLIVQSAVPPAIPEIADKCGEALCTFITGLTLSDLPAATIENVYTVIVDAEDYPGTDQVVFSMTGPGHSVGHDATQSGEVWSATFDMTHLPAVSSPEYYTITATAYDGSAPPEELFTTTSTFTVNPLPPWFNGDWVSKQTVDWSGYERSYVFTGRIPYNPDWAPLDSLYHEESTNLSYFGNVKTAGGVRIDVNESYYLQGDPYKYGDGGIEAIILGVDILNSPFDMSWDRTTDEYGLQWDSGTILDYSVNLYDGTLFSGVVDFIEFEIHLSVDFGLTVSFHLGDEALDPATIDKWLRFSPICLTPEINPSVSFDASLDLFTGVVSFGLIGTPTFDIFFPICYDYYGDPELYVEWCVKFKLLVEAYVSACWGRATWSTGEYTLGETQYGSHCPSRWPGMPGGRDSGDPPSGGHPAPFGSPRIASDGQGKAMCVWIHDNNAGDSPPDPDVWYSYYNGASWSEPTFVAETSLFESDPRVTFLQPGKAMLVVTENQMDQATAEAEDYLSVILSEQELVYYVFEGGAWGAKGFVHMDNPGLERGDGRAELTPGPDANPFVIWVRDPEGELEPPCNSDIMVSRWSNAGGGQWSSPPTALRANLNVAFVEPDIAFDSAGNALAVWIRDEDGEQTTGNDRSIEACFFDSDTQMWGGVFEAIGSEVLPGMLWPTVGFDLAGVPVVVFTTRGDNGDLMPSEAEYGEGTHDFLFAASPTLPLPTAFDRVVSVGGPWQSRARWPRMTIWDGGQRQGDSKFFVGCRTFRSAGGEAYDGEVGITMKARDTGDPTDYWPAPTRFTDDGLLDWQIDLDADNFADVIRAVWVKPSAGDPCEDGIDVFGDGCDGIKLLEIDLGQDVAITAESIALSSPFPRQDETLSIRIRVKNSGSDDIATPITVDCYLDSVEPANHVGHADILQSRYQRLETVTMPYLADGYSHTLIVVLDEDDTIDETNEADNQASIPIVATPPPDRLTVAADVSEQSLALTWDSPQVRHPAAPPVATYRVYRDTGGGFSLLAETPGLVYVDDTVTAAVYQVTAVIESGAESEPAGPVTGAVPAYGDGDGDADIDLSDCRAFVDCLTGPGQGPIPFDCEVMDFNQDDDADLEDFVAFQRAFTGAAVCGNGSIEGDEECDDGGESATCDADCTVAECGDGTLNVTAGEECDDGGESATCDADCTVAECGDGTLNVTSGEECDDGGESATCDTDCTVAECGDGTLNVTAGEECDDGGESATCDTDCTFAECGDGTHNPTAGEECDDGNNEDGDGCSADCLIEEEPLPECVVTFDSTCPNVAPECGVYFEGPGDCVSASGDCVDTPPRDYRLDASGPLLITLDGDLNKLYVFFAGFFGSVGTMGFFDAEGLPVDAPLVTDWDCVTDPPRVYLRTFSRPVRSIVVTASSDWVWIDTFHVNPTPP